MLMLFNIIELSDVCDIRFPNLTEKQKFKLNDFAAGVTEMVY